MKNTIVVCGGIPTETYSPITQSFRKRGIEPKVIKLKRRYFPRDEECFELFYLTMGISSADMATIYRNHGVTEKQIHDYLQDAEGSNVLDPYHYARLAILEDNDIDLDSVGAVVFDHELGWSPNDIAKLFFAKLDIYSATSAMAVVINGKLVYAYTKEFDMTYNFFIREHNIHPL
ncbi:MAG: hypothetical protein WCN86_00020 [bacterium]